MKNRRKVVVVGAIFSLALVLVSVVLVADWLWSQSVRNQFSIGSSEAQVFERAGVPDRHIPFGNAIAPPHVSGWCPPQPTNGQTVLVYFKYRFVIYVYLNSDRAVEEVFIRTP